MMFPMTVLAAPDFAGNAGNQFELALLILVRDAIALYGRGEAALGTESQTF